MAVFYILLPGFAIVRIVRVKLVFLVNLGRVLVWRMQLKRHNFGQLELFQRLVNIQSMCICMLILMSDV